MTKILDLLLKNLLPERGRFELMHATDKNVLWWGILDAGEKVPGKYKNENIKLQMQWSHSNFVLWQYKVHTIGLDAPILLLVNLGFCRTPVGEGALVHNGRDSAGLFKAGWHSLGHVMKTSKDKVKQTLFTVTESKGNIIRICCSSLL